MRVAAIYARVSSDRQKEDKTIASQTAALRAFAKERSFSVPDEWVIEDEGYSGANLIRPGLESLRDLAAEGSYRLSLRDQAKRRRRDETATRQLGVLARPVLGILALDRCWRGVSWHYNSNSPAHLAPTDRTPERTNGVPVHSTALDGSRCGNSARPQGRANWRRISG